MTAYRPSPNRVKKAQARVRPLSAEDSVSRFGLQRVCTHPGENVWYLILAATHWALAARARLFGQLLQRSVYACHRRLDVPAPHSSWTTRPTDRWMVSPPSSPRKRLDFRLRLPGLLVAHAGLSQGVIFSKSEIMLYFGSQR